MCGIGGASLSPQSKLPMRQFMHALLLHNEERGKVASGYAYQVAGKTRYHKDAVSGGHLALKHFERAARTGIVHTRNATFGKPEDNDNNHPVLDSTNNIVLIHNGVIQNHEAIRDGMKDEPFAAVDSSVLPTLIREYGVDGLAETTGWAAVAWLDHRDQGTLHLARVQGSAPLLVVGLKDGSIVFGSTFLIVHAALIECGYGDQIDWAFEAAELTYLKVRAGRITHMENLRKFEQAKARFKAAKALSWQEQKRLEAITNGTDQSGTTPATTPTMGYAPTHPASHTVGVRGPVPQPSYTPQGGQGGVVTYGPPKAVSSTKFVPPATDLVVLEDPLARINQAFKDTPPAPHVGTVTSIPIKQPTYSPGYGGSYLPPKAVSTTFPPEVEDYLVYWYCFTGESVETLSLDNCDTEATYDEFVSWVNELVRKGELTDWGILGVNDVFLSTKHFVQKEEEIDFLLDTVTNMMNADTAEHGSMPLDLGEDVWDEGPGSLHGTPQSSFAEVNAYLGRYNGYSDYN